MLDTRDGVEFARCALEALETMPLECDGVSRALSQVLLHAGVAHELHIGGLEVMGVGKIPLHYWVVLPDGAHCDIRARMWLGADPAVPHGVFVPTSSQRYEARAEVSPEPEPVLFEILTGLNLQAFTQRLACPKP